MKPASAFAILLVISALSESRIMVKFDLAKVLFLDLLTKYTDYHLPVVARNEKYNGKSENLVNSVNYCTGHFY